MQTTEITTTLKTLAARVRLQVQYEPVTPWGQQDEWQQKATGYRCRMLYKGRSYSFDFWQGSAHKDDPTAEGCLECLLSDANCAENTFEDFCSELGYDTDSRKAEATFKACKIVRKNMERLLGSDFEAFLYADRN